MASLPLVLALSLGTVASHSPRDEVEQLVAAAGKGDAEEVRRLMNPARLAGTAGWRGHGALHAAADAGQREIVALVLEAGAPIDQLSRKGWSALALAAERGHLAVVELLLARGADPAPAQADPASAPLLLAAGAGHFAVARQLLEGVAPTTPRDPRGMSALHLAAAEGHATLVELLLTHPDGAALLDEADQHGWTALHAAAAAGELEVARRLIEAGAAPAPRNDAGWTPLHVAAATGLPTGDWEALAALPGANRAALDPLGRTAEELVRVRAAGGTSAPLTADSAHAPGAPLFALARTMGYPGPVTPPNGLLLAIWEDGVVAVAADPQRAGESIGVVRLGEDSLTHLRSTVAGSGIFDLPPTVRLGMHAPEDRLVWPVDTGTVRHGYGKNLRFYADSPAEYHPGTRGLIRSLRDFHAALAVAVPPESARRPLTELAGSDGRFRGYDPARPFRSRWLH